MDKEEIIKHHIDILKSFVVQKNIDSCKTYLDNLDTIIKGKVFEYFLAELYRGNGFHVQINGGKGDKGADLLIRPSDNPEDIAFIVQAKNHKSPLTKKDTFSEVQQFREGIKNKIFSCKRYRLITLNGFVSDAYLYQNKGWVALYNFEHIKDLVDDYCSHEKIKPSVDLRVHNKNTYEEILSLKQYKNQVSIIQATGTGKSYLIYQLFADNFEKKKLLVAPSKYIIDQFQKDEKYGWLMQGVDTLHYQNKQFFLEQEIEKSKYDVIVLDEFHRTGAKTYEPKIKALLANNPNAFVLGATATPIRTDGKNMNEVFDFEYASDISLPKAIIKEYIPNPTYVASLIDLEEEIDYLKKSLENSKNPKLNKEVELENLEQIKLDWKKSNGVDKIFKKYLTNSSLQNFIVFCEDIETLRKYKHKVSDWFVEAGFQDAVPFMVHSNQTDKENDKAIFTFTNFRNPKKIALLFAVDMFNEGLHIKNVDGVILLRKTTSHIVFYQQIGRCLQVGNKSPIIFDLVNNFASVEASNFLRQLNEEKVKEQYELEKEGLEDDTPNFKVFDQTIDIKEILESIEEKFQTWDFWFDLANKWKSDKKINKTGNAHIPSRKIYDGYKLGFWYDNQRASKEMLERKFPIRYKKLVEYGIEWRNEETQPKRSFNETLNEKIFLLKEYFELNGTGDIPKRLVTAKKLGHNGWNKQLATYMHHTLDAKKKARVLNDNSLKIEIDGIEYVVRDYLKKINYNFGNKPRIVDEVIERLKQEWKTNSNFSEADFISILVSEKKFAAKVNKLRNYMNDLEDYPIDYYLPGEIDELLALGFIPSKKAKNWIELFEELKEIYKKTNSCLVKEKSKGVMGLWCKEQYYYREFLKNEQIELLEQLNFFDTWGKYLAETRSETREKTFKMKIDEIFLNYDSENSTFTFKKKSSKANFIEAILRYGVSKERVEYLKNKGYDLFEQRKLYSKRGI
jgi:superfamily II DNA or RNA helicase